MSHYAVAVFADTPYDFDRLLAPYNENSHSERFVADEETLKQKYKQFLIQNPGWEELGFEYYLEQFDYKREGDEVVYYSNPNAKYDYYCLDGKDYMFDLKSGVDYEDDRRMKDYDLDKEDEDVDENYLIKFWDFYVEKGVKEVDGQAFMTLYSPEYYLEKYGTKENFIKSQKRIIPYAFVTPDGAWHAPGNVGWFALDDSTQESMDNYVEAWSKYIHSDINPYVSFVDCHI